MLQSLDLNSLLLTIAALSAAGLVAGILAGIFGIGGGAVMVPALIEFFRIMDMPLEIIAHLAVGTSLGVIVPTGLRSYMAHRKGGAPDNELLSNWIIWVPLGVVLASLLATQVSGNVLKMIFGVVAFIVAIKILAKIDKFNLGTDLPSGWPLKSVGFVIGLLSALMGAGGGIFNNMFMTSFGRPIHQAVATSSGVGVLIAIPGLFGFIWAGWGHASLPSFTLGYVHVLAAILVIPASIFAAPIGARLAHSLPRRQLEIAYGLFMALVAIRMLSSALQIE